MNTSSHRTGMAVPLVLTIILVLAALGGAVYYSQRDSSESPEDVMEKKDEVMTEKSPAPTPDAMMDKKDAANPGTSFVPGGTVLAGKTSVLIDYNKADYDRALAEGRVILLYFYANWCPTCKAELPALYGAFNELTDPRLVGFRVSYNDSETDQYEEALARQFGIAYQHTKVFLKSGQQVLKNGESWDKNRYLAEVSNVLK